MHKSKVKARVRRHIIDSKSILKEIMQRNLGQMAQAMVSQISARLSRSTESTKWQAIVDVDQPGTLGYKQELQEALAVIAQDSVEQVRGELPEVRKVKWSQNEEGLKLGEFDNLPNSMKNRVQKTVQLVIDTQSSDLNKAIAFQFTHSIDSTDSDSQVANDLDEAASDYIDGNATEAGASTLAAQTINEARNDFFQDPDVSDAVDALEFVNADPVTEICTDLNGTVFSSEDPDAFRYSPPLHFNAVIEGTKIEVKNLGSVAIEHIEPGQFVLTHTGAFCEVYNVMSKFEDKEYFVLTLEDGKQISITAEHPVFTKRGWLRVDNLTLLDEIICAEDLQDTLGLSK